MNPSFLRPDAMPAALTDLAGAGRAARSYYAASLRKGTQPPEDEPVLWLLTFTDIMALLLTFFVLLYSMSEPIEKKWEELSTGISSEFRQYDSAEWRRGEQAAISLGKITASRGLDLGYLGSVVSEILARDKSLKDIVIRPGRGEIVISLPQSLLFESGDTKISAEGKRALYALGASLSRIRNRIEVVGHADPRPAQKADNAGNWALSLSRAASVAQALSASGYARPINVRGLSSGRYEELPAAMPEKDKLAIARRVDVVVMKDAEPPVWQIDAPR